MLGPQLFLPLNNTAGNAGAGMVININASPFQIDEVDRAEQRLRVVAGRARALGTPIVYVNQVGLQDELVFDGASFVVDAGGVMTQRGRYFREQLLVAEFDMVPEPVPRKAGIESAEHLDASAYQALVLGVRDYVDKNGFTSGAVVGLSGGIDSALTLAVAVDALGPDMVTAIMMPSRYSADMSLQDARLEVESLGVGYHVIPIESMFNSFLDGLGELFQGLAHDTTEENLQARCRGVVLMAISNKFSKIVLTTGNKSEMAVGYATLYGDMAGGFAVIKDVPKTMVYRLARYRNSRNRVIPERVLTRPPSAELKTRSKGCGQFAGLRDSGPHPGAVYRIRSGSRRDHCGRVRSRGGVPHRGHGRSQRIQTSSGAAGSTDQPPRFWPGPPLSHYIGLQTEAVKLSIIF